MDYEELVGAIAHIDAAKNIIFGHERDSMVLEQVANDLNEARNTLNDQRVRMLGNERNRPFNVDDLIRSKEAAA